MMNKIPFLARKRVWAVLVLWSASFVWAGEYVPPPAGPYKPEVVVSDSPSFAQENSGKVYKFPSEDLIRSAAPPALSFERPEQGGGEKLTVKPDYSPHKPTTEAAVAEEYSSSGQNYRHQPPVSRQRSVPAGGYTATNPWSPEAQSATPRQQPAYPAVQGWYPNQYGYSQRTPYGYGYPNYYANPDNSASAPFSDMPTPWSMMPMQPFFPGR